MWGTRESRARGGGALIARPSVGALLAAPWPCADRLGSGYLPRPTVRSDRGSRRLGRAFGRIGQRIQRRRHLRAPVDVQRRDHGGELLAARHD
jgi:hypothetical protein